MLSHLSLMWSVWNSGVGGCHQAHITLWLFFVAHMHPFQPRQDTNIPRDRFGSVLFSFTFWTCLVLLNDLLLLGVVPHTPPCFIVRSVGLYPNIVKMPLCSLQDSCLEYAHTVHPFSKLGSISSQGSFLISGRLLSYRCPSALLFRE